MPDARPTSSADDLHPFIGWFKRTMTVGWLTYGAWALAILALKWNGWPFIALWATDSLRVGWRMFWDEQSGRIFKAALAVAAALGGVAARSHSASIVAAGLGADPQIATYTLDLLTLIYTLIFAVIWLVPCGFPLMAGLIAAPLPTGIAAEFGPIYRKHRNKLAAAFHKWKQPRALRAALYREWQRYKSVRDANKSNRIGPWPCVLGRTFLLLFGLVSIPISFVGRLEGPESERAVTAVKYLAVQMDFRAASECANLSSQTNEIVMIASIPNVDNDVLVGRAPATFKFLTVFFERFHPSKQDTFIFTREHCDRRVAPAEAPLSDARERPPACIPACAAAARTPVCTP